MIFNIALFVILSCMLFLLATFLKGKTFIQIVVAVISIIGTIGFAIIFMVIAELLKDVLSE